MDIGIVTLLVFTALALGLIISGLVTVIKGEITIFNHDYTGIRARIMGGILIFIGLFPASVAFVYLNLLIHGQ